MRCLNISNFAGGFRDWRTENIAPNESHGTYRLWHQQGSLISMEGRVLHNATQILTDTPIMSHDRFYKTGYPYDNVSAASCALEARWLAKCGGAVWLDVDDAGDFRPILARTAGGRENFAQAGGRAYMTNGQDATPYRFAGEFYRLGGVTASGTTITGDGTASQNFLTADTNGSMRPGDSVFFKVSGAYVLTARILKHVTDATHFSVYTGPGAIASAVPYVVARTGQMGIDPSDLSFFASSYTLGGLGLWQANTGYEDGAARVPITKTGYFYVVTTVGSSGAAEPTWPTTPGGHVTDGTVVWACGIARHWETATAYTLGDLVVPTTTNGHYYRCITAGTSHATTEPTWTTTDWARFAEATGTVVWQEAGTTQYTAAMAAGNYWYKVTYYNSKTGMETNASVSLPVTVPNATGNNCVPVVPPSNPGDYQIDEIRIYRTKVNTTTPYYYVGALKRRGKNNIFPNRYCDGVLDTALDETVTAPWENDPPPQLVWLSAYNGKLYGYGNTTHPDRHYWSTTNAAEYFPPKNFATTDWTTVDLSAGGYADLGGLYGDKVMAIVPESGIRSVLGTLPGALLIFTKTKCYRWSGYDWSDFAITDIFSIGCMSHQSACNVSGYVFWMARNGPMMLRPGSETPVPIYEKIWRAGIGETLTGTKDFQLGISVGAGWGDSWYALAFADGANTVNNKLLMFYLPTESFTAAYTLAEETHANWLLTAGGPGDDGSLYAADAEKGYLWQLFTKTGSNTYWETTPTGVPFQFRSNYLYLADSPEEMYALKIVPRIELWFKQPTAAQTVTAYLYGMGDNTTVLDTKTITLAASTTMRKQRITWLPGKVDRVFQIVISGTVTRAVELLGIDVYYDTAGPGDGTKES